MSLVALGEYFNDDSPVLSGAKQGIDRRQMAVESYIDNAAAHRRYDAAILAHKILRY
jgi:hypothetical protein